LDRSRPWRDHFRLSKYRPCSLHAEAKNRGAARFSQRPGGKFTTAGVIEFSRQSHTLFPSVSLFITLPQGSHWHSRKSLCEKLSGTFQSTETTG
jgi:hypothetical protein